MQIFESFVAQRYLKTRRKGAFVRILTRYARWGIALGVFVLVITQALMNGFKDEIQANLFTATGHFQIFHLAGDLPDTKGSMALLKNVPGVTGLSPFRFEQALLKSEMASRPAEPIALKCVDPATARQTSSMFNKTEPIRIEALQEGDILVGKELAQNQGLRVGDTVSLTFMHMDLGLAGLSPKVVAFRIAGFFESHISEYDRKWAFIHLEDGLRLAGTDRAEFIEVRTQGLEAIDEVKAAALQMLNSQKQGLYRALDMRDQNKAMFSALKFEKLVFMIILALIVVLAAFNIVAILVLFITEKRRDLGVLLALGATPRQIQRIFEYQGIRICLTGTLWGLGLSIPTCLIADRYKLFKLPPALYDFITYIPFKLETLDMIMVAFFPLIVAWAASRYPARRAAEVNPVDALRSE